MMKYVLLFAGAFLALSLVILPGPALTYSGGAPAMHTGAPGESTCGTSACHNDTPNTGPGSVAIKAASSYPLGQVMMIQVDVPNMVGGNVQGFEVTVKDAGGNHVGELQLVDAGLTQFAGMNPNYVTHTSAGRNRTSWTVAWMAPNSDIGAITIYAAGLDANGDGGRLGDRVYTTSWTMSPPNLPPEVVMPIADQELEVGGSPFTADLADVFSDDGPLTFSVSADPDGVVSASVSGSVLTVTAVAEGVATVTVTADDGTNPSVSDAFTVTVTDMGTDTEDEALPAEFALHGAHPNPFRTAAVVTFDLPEPAEVSLRLYDVRGREVGAVPPQAMGAGAHHVRIAGRHLAAGIYTYRLTVEGASESLTASGRLIRVH